MPQPSPNVHVHHEGHKACAVAHSRTGRHVPHLLPGRAVLGTQVQPVDELGTSAAIDQHRDQDDEEGARQHHLALAVCKTGHAAIGIAATAAVAHLQPKHCYTTSNSKISNLAGPAPPAVTVQRRWRPEGRSTTSLPARSATSADIGAAIVLYLLPCKSGHIRPGGRCTAHLMRVRHFHFWWPQQVDCAAAQPDVACP